VILYLFASIILFFIGLWGVASGAQLLRKVIALNIMGGATFLFLVGSAYRGSEPPDPVPHAMVLTGIVVAFSATALAIALVRRLEGTRR
jgi:multicomponent Na+:H+ antiporter subunit C